MADAYSWGVLYCPQLNCKQEIPTEPPYWLKNGQWYCSEECARRPMSQPSTKPLMQALARAKVARGALGL